jgi:hypothetical protein
VNDQPKELTVMNKFNVEVKHPTGFHKGTHVVTVHESFMNDQVRKYCADRKLMFLSCSASEFGCSRDYFVKNPEEAIRTFLAEHACSVVNVKKIKV